MSKDRRNAPVVNLYEALAPDALDYFLKDRFANHQRRYDELAAAYKRFLGATAKGIQDDATAAKAADFANQVRAAIKDTDETRVAIKEPVLAATRQIDGYSRVICEPLVDARRIIEGKITEHLQVKDREARLKAQEEADRKVAEVQRLLDIAQNEIDTETEQRLDTLGGQQAAAEAVINAKPEELTRIRTSLGSTTALKDNWVYVGATDMSLVPAQYLMVNEAAVKLAIRQGTHTILGLVIENKPVARVR
jgi:hypothetical protein